MQLEEKVEKLLKDREPPETLEEAAARIVQLEELVMELAGEERRKRQRISEAIQSKRRARHAQRAGMEEE